MNESSFQRPENPYIGPRSFRTGETLYGRTREVYDLAGLLIAERIVLLHSPSGAGKTSLIQAALIPQLEAQGFLPLPVIRVNTEPSANVIDDYLLDGLLSQQIFTREHKPVSGLGPMDGNRYVLSVLLSLEEGVPESQRLPLADLTALTLDEYLNQRASLIIQTQFEQFSHSDADAEDTDNVYTDDIPDAELLLFDQFEEILTIDPTDTDAKEAFFIQLGAMLRNRNRWALFSMRDDYVASLAPYLRHLSTRLDTRYRLDLLGVAAARQAIQQPVQRVGVAIADDAVTRLVDDLRRVHVQQVDGTIKEQSGPYVEPVQLQVVCYRLWEHLPADKQCIEVSDLVSLGDVDQALAGYYAERVAAIAQATGIHEREIRRWFNYRLITEQGIRGQVLQGSGQSDGLDNRAIYALIDAHIVRGEKRRGTTWFELAHDRLITPVQTDNAAWFDQHLSTFERVADAWERQGRPDSLLLRGVDLDEAEQWVAAHIDELSPVEQEYLAKCREEHESVQREQRNQRRIRLLAIAASVVSVLATIAFVVALMLFQQTERQEQVSVAREFTTHARNTLSQDPERAILLGVQAVKHASVDPMTEANAVDALQQAVQTTRLLRVLEGHEDAVYQTAFSPNDTLLASASADGTAKMWDLANGQVLFSLEHPDSVDGVDFSTDGSKLVTACEDGIIRLWDVSTGDLLHQLEGHEGGAYKVAYSPDGLLIASAGDDGARLWDATTYQQKHVFGGYEGSVWDVAFTPDSTRLATGSDDGIDIWDVAKGELVSPLVSYTDSAYRVAFYTDGERLAAVGNEKFYTVVDVSQDTKLLPVRANTDTPYSVAFSPDGSHVASAGFDTTVRVRLVADSDFDQPPSSLFDLPGHTELVWDTVFNHNATRIATASQDKTIRIWDSSGHTDTVMSVTFSPDGTELASSSVDTTAKRWMVTNQIGEPFLTEMAALSGHTDLVRNVAYNPDGSRLATASNDSTALVWNRLTGQVVYTCTHESDVFDVAFSSDGALLVTVSLDATAKVWDMSNGTLLHTLAHPDADTTEDWLWGVAMSPDNAFIATAGKNATVTIWNISNESAIATFMHDSSVLDVAYSPDGTLLVAACEDGSVVVWDVASGQQRYRVAHTKQVPHVDFSPDGTWFATASVDKTAKLWDTATGDLVATFTHSAGVNGVAFSPDGLMLATGNRIENSVGRTLNIYPLKVDTLYAMAKTRLTRWLTLDECKTFLYKEECPSDRE